MEHIPFVVRCPLNIFDFDDYKNESMKDIFTYISRACKQSKLQKFISSRNLRMDEFVRLLSEKSKCNFMYLFYVLPEIEHGIYQDLSIERLPFGLEGYYEDHWDRMGMRAKPLPRDKIIILYILCESRQPVSRTLITDFAKKENPNIDELVVQDILDEWRQFLHIQRIDAKTYYSIYHTSFYNFLRRKDILQAACVTIKGINRLIADNLWRVIIP